MRDSEVSQSAARTYHASRRPRRPVIVQVPAIGATPEKQTKRSVLVPYTPRPIYWKEARALGRAYGRILEALPPYLSAKAAEEARLDAIKAAEARQYLKAHPELRRVRLKRESGMWWKSKFADMVDRRTVITTPAFAPRKGRKHAGGRWPDAWKPMGEQQRHAREVRARETD